MRWNGFTISLWRQTGYCNERKASVENLHWLFLCKGVKVIINV